MKTRYSNGLTRTRLSKILAKRHSRDSKSIWTSAWKKFVFVVHALTT